MRSISCDRPPRPKQIRLECRIQSAVSRRARRPRHAHASGHQLALERDQIHARAGAGRDPQPPGRRRSGVRGPRHGRRPRASKTKPKCSRDFIGSRKTATWPPEQGWDCRWPSILSKTCMEGGSRRQHPGRGQRVCGGASGGGSTRVSSLRRCFATAVAARITVWITGGLRPTPPESQTRDGHERLGRFGQEAIQV